MQGDSFVSELGGIMQVALWLILVGLWSSLGLVANYVVVVLGNEGGHPHDIQGRNTWGLCVGLKKLHKIWYLVWLTIWNYAML